MNTFCPPVSEPIPMITTTMYRPRNKALSLSSSPSLHPFERRPCRQKDTKMSMLWMNMWTDRKRKKSLATCVCSFSAAGPICFWSAPAAMMDTGCEIKAKWILKELRDYQVISLDFTLVSEPSFQIQSQNTASSQISNIFAIYFFHQLNDFYRTYICILV